MDVRCVVKSDDRLGEGPCWSPREGRLYWFDIKGKRLAWYEPEERRTRAPSTCPCAQAPQPRGGRAACSWRPKRAWRSATRTPATLEMRPAHRPAAGLPDQRRQDRPRRQFLVVDHGRRRRQAAGRGLPHHGRTFRPSRCSSGIHIPNTISVSPDGKRLYMADSKLPDHLRPRHGRPRRRCARVRPHRAARPASPDGSAVDAHGYLWNAQWGGWRLVRYTPRRT